MPLPISALVLSLALLPRPDVYARVRHWLGHGQATQHPLAVVPTLLGVGMSVAHCKHLGIAAVHRRDETGAADSPTVFVPGTAPRLVPDSAQMAPLHSHSWQAVVVRVVLELVCLDALAVIRVSLSTSAFASRSETHMHHLEVVLDFCL